MKKHRPEQSARQVGYGKLMLQSLPEIFCFQLLSGIPMAALTWALTKLLKLVAESGGSAVTTANLAPMLLSWRGPVILVLGALLVAVFAAFEIFAQVHLFDDILHGRRLSILGEIVKGLKSLKLFLCPSGLLVLLYIFIAVPLLGVGFSISLTDKFYIPNFIMEVVRAKPLFYVAYCAVIAALAAVGICGIFTLHGVIIDKLKPSKAFRRSFRALKKNWKDFLAVMLVTALVIALIVVGVSLMLGFAANSLEKEAAQFPQGHFVDVDTIFGGGATETDIDVIAYRVGAALLVVGGGLLIYLLDLLLASYFLMRLTRCYLEYTGSVDMRWPSRPRRVGFVVRTVLLFILMVMVVILISAIVGFGFNSEFDRAEPARIVAHRTGGVMAPENSLEGIELAIQHGCYACETDTQRTKDGYYIINHDDDFKRLTGVNKKPGDMTLEEVRQLTITDPATGATSKVPELDEMLDVVKGRVKLFIELKGATADRQMVDDVVKMVREKDCVADVALISLKYDVIDYAETTYPEFETGMLIFGSLGDVTRANCDLMVLEEEMSTDELIDHIHEAGKEVYVWTINTEEGMKKFLAGKCDGIITDQIELSMQVQDQLNRRTDYQVIEDGLGNFWD